MPIKSLIACFDVPTATQPGHLIKDRRPPYVPVASVYVTPGLRTSKRAELHALTLAMAKGPEALALLQRLCNSSAFRIPEFAQLVMDAEALISREN